MLQTHRVAGALCMHFTQLCHENFAFMADMKKKQLMYPDSHLNSMQIIVRGQSETGGGCAWEKNQSTGFDIDANGENNQMTKLYQASISPVWCDGFYSCVSISKYFFGTLFLGKKVQMFTLNTIGSRYASMFHCTLILLVS